MRLSVSGLVCVRGNREVFSGLNFQVGGGEMLVVRGPNGSGKTSLLRILAGLVPPAGGCIELSDANPQRTLAEQAHYLGHLDALKPSLTVAENLGFWARYLGIHPAKPCDALHEVGLETVGDLPAAYLSAGQRRRLGLARLLAAARPIWLLDEPTSALDAAAQKRLGEVMSRQLAAGGLIVAATHGPLGVPATRELALQ
jgi:heme exporter protein A